MSFSFLSLKCFYKVVVDGLCLSQTETSFLLYVLYANRFLLISLRNLLYNSPKLTNTYKQISTVIYDRLLVITNRNKSAPSSYFESRLPLVNSPCFHTSMHFTGGSPFYAFAPCLKSLLYCSSTSIERWTGLPEGASSNPAIESTVFLLKLAV